MNTQLDGAPPLASRTKFPCDSFRKLSTFQKTFTLLNDFKYLYKKESWYDFIPNWESKTYTSTCTCTHVFTFLHRYLLPSPLHFPFIVVMHKVLSHYTYGCTVFPDLPFNPKLYTLSYNLLTPMHTPVVTCIFICTPIRPGRITVIFFP